MIASFLRLLSSPKIFQDPTPVEDAVAFVDALLATIHVGEYLVSFDRDFRKLIGWSQFTLLKAAAG